MLLDAVGLNRKLKVDSHDNCYTMTEAAARTGLSEVQHDR